MILKSLAAIVALTASAGAAAAPVANACFTVPEMQALAAVATGPALSGIATRCSAFPAAAPALTAARASLPSRFKAQSAAAGPVIGAKLAQAMGLTGASANQTADAFAPIIGLVVAQMSAKLAEKECRLVDDVVGTLLPLDDARLVAIVGGMLTAVARDPKQQMLRLCDPTAH